MAHAARNKPTLRLLSSVTETDDLVTDADLELEMRVARLSADLMLAAPDVQRALCLVLEPLLVCARRKGAK